MAKHLKLRISRFFPTFHSCRSKDPSTLPENPHPVASGLSPVNPKAIDIDFPANAACPHFPPPLTVRNHYSFLKRHVSCAMASVTCGCRPISGGSGGQHGKSSGDMPQYKWKKEDKWHVVARVNEESPRRKIYNSSLPGDSEEHRPPMTEVKMTIKKKKQTSKKSKPRVRISTSSTDSGWFSSDGGEEVDDEETETLVCSSRSLSTDSFSDFNPRLETIRESPSVMKGLRGHKKNKQKNVKKLKRQVSRSNGGFASGKTTTECGSPETEVARLSVFRRMIPCVMDGKVRESFAVVKKSEDPYQDFKNSMLEMIVEKHMFEAKDLEQLLQCFLSLNSRQHHDVIVDAFSEIWESLFCKSPMTRYSTSSFH
ncbi:PREDICTED: transcription repressor OFP7-like [Nelumbo nucifera]|uniref:Transcription repressor n=2 Tax=Nelumbo nucifera TaxID=4432 RepID=A0A1U7YV44_NELNU|nr:PREDICTED: transcription repressor OFP7-like [Nelumbo nucifera]DAD21719.1 TPA_asm: hypothetical protein HUJ06_023182 [Nelumbo nucifera]